MIKLCDYGNINTYWNPVRILRSVDFPAPDGPIIAVNSPQLKRPETPLSTCFFSKTIYTFN